MMNNDEDDEEARYKYTSKIRCKIMMKDDEGDSDCDGGNEEN